MSMIFYGRHYSIESITLIKERHQYIGSSILRADRTVQSQSHEKMKKTETNKTPRLKKFRGLFYWGKFLGLNPFSLSKDYQLDYSYFSLFYCCFLSFFHSHAYYFSLISESKVLLREETPMSVIVNFVALSWQFMEILSSWLVSVIYQNRLKMVVDSFVTAEKISEKLGMPEDWDKQFKNFRTHVILNNVLYLVSVMVSGVMMSFFDDYDLFVWTRSDLLALAPLNERIVVIWCLMLVRRKFRRLNEIVRFLHRPNEGEERSSGLMPQLSCDSNLVPDRVNMISQLHRELRHIIYRIERHFGPFVLCTIVNSLTCLTLNLYGICHYTEGYSRQAKDWIYVAAMFHWVFYPLALLILLSNVCGTTLDEANNTASLLHDLLNTCEHGRDARESAIFHSLSLDLLNNRVSMSVMGLFKLDHFLVYCNLTTAASYLMIMLQLYE